jgi:hypothetical protein
VTHEGLTTMTHSSRTGWTIMSGTWNHLRKVWGPTPDTLAKIHQQWRHQPSFPQVPKERSAGGEHETRTRFTYGILWAIRIDKTRWRSLLSLDKNTRAGCWGNKIKG